MIGERLCFSMNFFKSQRGKIQTEKNQLFSWLKKEGKTEASACLIDWPVGPVSANFTILRTSNLESLNQEFAINSLRTEVRDGFCGR